MQVVYLGGANEVGASSILLKLSNKNILLDCGIRQNKNKDKLPDFSMISSLGGVDAIVISHAHMDHIGSLPIISKEYPKAPIYMNKMTYDLVKVLLYDSLKIMNYNEAEIPIFNEDDVLNMLSRVILIPYQKEESISDKITLTFYMAGHIVGASCCYLKSKEGSVFYTGDFSLTTTNTISKMSIPKLRPDVVISETTYGNRMHANRELEERRLVEKANAIINNEGKVLIPVFALGRSQEVLLILKKAIIKKQLSKVKIYVDGMVQNINAVIKDNPLYLKESLGKKILREKEIFYDDNVIKVTDDKQRENILSSTDACIIVTSSGMLLGGRSEYYASSIVEDVKNAIILTGYQDEESNGRMLLDLMKEEKALRKLKLNGKVHNINCDIDLAQLSAHADKSEIMSLMHLLKPKNVILGHGEQSAIEEFASLLTSEMNTSVYVPNVGDILAFDIRNPRKQITKTLDFLYSGNGDIEDFYYFIKEHYNDKLFTKEDLAYIYYGKNALEEEVMALTKKMIASIYFTQDKYRYFLFKISDELDIMKENNKQVTFQELEEDLIGRIKDYPYKKISFYKEDKRIVVTFDFPRVIDKEFDKICESFHDKTGYLVQKNDNINNLACENIIKEEIGKDNIQKISYHPLDDYFKIKVYSLPHDDIVNNIKNKIGYDINIVLVPKTTVTAINEINNTSKNPNQKMEQNEAFSYIDYYFINKEHKPYKKSIKNQSIVLSFITYEIGERYSSYLNELSTITGYDIVLNKIANLSLIFSEVDSLLKKYNLTKIKNPSYLPNENKVSVKVTSYDQKNVESLQKEFYDKVGLEIKIIN